jgi:hypothetical protein
MHISVKIGTALPAGTEGRKYYQEVDLVSPSPAGESPSETTTPEPLLPKGSILPSVT